MRLTINEIVLVIVGVVLTAIMTFGALYLAFLYQHHHFTFKKTYATFDYPLSESNHADFSARDIIAFFEKDD